MEPALHTQSPEPPPELLPHVHRLPCTSSQEWHQRVNVPSPVSQILHLCSCARQTDMPFKLKS